MDTARTWPGSWPRTERNPPDQISPTPSKASRPNANIVNLRVLDANGNGQESDVIAAIDEAIALKDKYNIRVINLSLGHPVYESFKLDPLCQAVEAAWKAGITVVVAAGNMGRDNSLGTHGLRNHQFAG